MKSYSKLLQARVKLLLREPLTLFFTVVFPSLFLLLMGSVFGRMGETFGAANEGFSGADDAANIASQFTYGVDRYVPALMGLLLGTLALNTIPVSAATNREQGILRRFKATPMPAWQWIAAEISAYFTIGLLSAGLLIAVGAFAFDVEFSGDWSQVCAGFTLSALSFMAFGYLVASLAPTARAASVGGQLLYMPMIFVSGATMPLSIMPDGIQAVSQWLPMTHIVILMQDIWFGRGVPMLSVWVLVGILVVGGALSARLFRWE